MHANPLLQASTLPYQLPPFDQVDDQHYREAFSQGMAAQLREVAAVTGQTGAPSFDNTIVALERSGQQLDRAMAVFFNLIASHTNDVMQQLESELAPLLAAHEDAIALDSKLFARVNTLFERRLELDLEPEAVQLVERYHAQFVRAGARLSDADKSHLKAINAQISSLTTQFKQNVFKATSDGAVVVDGAAELDGLAGEQISAAAAAAAARGLADKWLITLHNTTTQPLLAQLSNRALRERLFKASTARGRGGSADNTRIVQQLVALRARRAALLGYSNHATYQLADESAGSPAAVTRMLTELLPAALARAREDAHDLQQLVGAHAREAGFEPFALAPWDWPFYAERLRRARFDFDRAEVAPYFELNRVLHDGVFYSAHELYGLTFKERPDLPVYHPDVRIFEVFDVDGAPLALFLADYFARDTKQGGAWMNNFVRQARLLGLKPVVANNLNVPKPQDGRPALLTFEEVTTLFHEFGHALHGMLSNVRYPLLQGTNVPRDFVEFPSQFNEMWARDPKVLANFARHHRTGEPMPEALLAKVLAAQTFDQGYATTEYLAAALIDQAWHELGSEEAGQAADPACFEADVLARHGIDPALVPPRYHTSYFAHVFSGGYSAGYYAYIWSEVLARDAGDWFVANGGLRRANGENLRSKVLSRGRSLDPQAMFIDFYGRPPDVAPLVAYRGL
ncbi:MAG TPA: M3 family metallopeptidase [Steroidobacteraceae bacterium]|jgi:peptidyl-dipeptidase Dcp|nr:M3 family metallopeptidase [Steroidobacteraceae bacterium]